LLPQMRVVRFSVEITALWQFFSVKLTKSIIWGNIFLLF
jgi:hypothetical protein